MKEMATHSTMYAAVVMSGWVSYVTGFENEKPPSAFVKHGIRICRTTTLIKRIQFIIAKELQQSKKQSWEDKLFTNLLIKPHIY